MALRAEPVVEGAMGMPYKRENFIDIFNNISVFKNSFFSHCGCTRMG